MWPRVLMQLMELLPHIGRLVPMADRFLASKAANDKATEAAMLAMAEGVRGDLGQVTKAHAGLYRQLQELSAQVAVVGESAEAAKRAAGGQEERLVALEAKVASLGVWVKTGVVLAGLVLLVAIGVGLFIAKTP